MNNLGNSFGAPLKRIRKNKVNGMNIKRIHFIILSLLYLLPCAAANPEDKMYPIDTVALAEGLNSITKFVSEYEHDTLDTVKAEFALFFYSQLGHKDALSVGQIISRCVENIGDESSCYKFIQTYTKYLNHANFCLRANNTKGPVFNGHTYSFEECYNKVDRTDYENGVTTPHNYYAGSLVDECTRWVRAAENCQTYLIDFYSQKLESKDLSNKDKKKYECLLEKMQTGNITIPTSKMEKECGK